MIAKNAMDIDQDQESSDSNSSIEETDDDLSDLQKMNPYIKYFPNFATIKIEAKNSFNEIKENLVRSVYFNETRPGILHWTNRLER